MSRRLSREMSIGSDGQSSTSKESKIPRPSFGRRSSLTAPIASAKSLESQSSRKLTPKTSRKSIETRTSSTGDKESVASGSDSDKVQVTVRLRPLSEREQLRGDQEVWRALDQQTIGVNLGSDTKTKYAFDRVFDGAASNKQLYDWSAKRIVGSSMDGLNATVFVYGVTSSGKTHTMMGTQGDSGVVQRAIQDIFQAIEDTPDRDFLLRFSMLEIYNEVINDLLDLSRGQLKLREDPVKGFFVEGIKEETLVSADHALSVIAAGDANRKVSATAFNEGSSRSHTIMRLSIESSERPGPEHDPRMTVARTLSFLNLIDLAGSESAKATLTKDHTREGSFINKSLLTLGTVIAKLSDGNAVHIPYRDSKLTRLLQSSMTGSGARVSVIATITPASAQAEETHNTLKFASRAKKIEIRARRNEILDQSSLILRYQAEIRELRAALEEASRGRGVALTVDPLHPEVRNLRERLQEEHQALLQREQDKVGLEMRIDRLTRIILSSTRMSKVDTGMGWRYRQMLLQTPQEGGSVDNLSSEAALDTQSVAGFVHSTGSEHWQDRHNWDTNGDLGSVVVSIRSAGDLIAGERLFKHRLAPREESADSKEVSLLREQISVLAEELDSREQLGSEARSGNEANEALEVDLQIMSAERDFLEAKVKRGRTKQEALVANLQILRRQLLDSNIKPKVGQFRLKDLDDSSSDTDGRLEDLSPRERRPEETWREDQESAAQQNTMQESIAKEKSAAVAAQLEENARQQQSIEALTAELQRMTAAYSDQEIKLAESKRKLHQVTERERLVGESLKSASKEAKDLRTDLERLEVINNQMQGYNLDNVPDPGIHSLIASAQQAIERMQLSLQMRRMEAERQEHARLAAQAAQEKARQEQEALRLHQARQEAREREYQAQKEAREAALRASAGNGMDVIGPYQPMRIASRNLHRR